MTTVNINEFAQEKTCTFKGEKYSVRDNGAVLRHPNESTDRNLKRALDNQWTFGKENSSTPYLHIAGVRVHQIVAMAFHGAPPDVNDVVDHIDTNCRNNRPENLRWINRLDNALKNPASVKKIIYLCGSVEKFRENPSMISALQKANNNDWMRTVTPEEAKNCKRRMDVWAKSPNRKSKRLNHQVNYKENFKKRAFKPLQKWEIGIGREPGIDLAETDWCVQCYWNANVYFPCCPKQMEDDFFGRYFKNLKIGEVVAYSDNQKHCPKQSVLQCELIGTDESILVLVERADDKYSILGISFDKKSYHFYHYILGIFSNRDEASKAWSNKSALMNFGTLAYDNQKYLLRN